MDLLVGVDASGIALITINRPEKRNALNRQVLGELSSLWEELEARADVRALLITGAGDKAFIAGADIKEMAEMDSGQAREFSQYGQRIFRRLEQLSKPSVAALNGFTLGGGLELAMSCSIRIADPSAKFGVPEGKLGILTGFGGTQRLPRLVGKGRAMELLLTGDLIDAARAEQIGLVNLIAPPGELIPFCQAWIKKILLNAPHSLALTMQAVDVAMETSLEQGLAFEAAAFGWIRSTSDCEEGLRAFLEKRAPRFRSSFPKQN